MKDIIRQLTEAFGPSGYETEVTDLIKTMVEEHVDEIETDVLGNLIAVKRPLRWGRKLCSPPTPTKSAW